jgi:hypothetical protein
VKELCLRTKAGEALRGEGWEGTGGLQADAELVSYVWEVGQER